MYIIHFHLPLRVHIQKTKGWMFKSKTILLIECINKFTRMQTLKIDAFFAFLNL